MVSHPYPVFNGIFLTLPLDGIRQTGLRVPLLQEACEIGLARGEAPHDILEGFLASQGSPSTEESAALLFRIIQYIERQVVLVDALEDARYAQLNDMGGAESLQSLMQRVRRRYTRSRPIGGARARSRALWNSASSRWILDWKAALTLRCTDCRGPSVEGRMPLT